MTMNKKSKKSKRPIFMPIKDKPKLFTWHDFLVPTGFSTVATNLLEDMYKYYDVSTLGINYFGNTRYDTTKYFVYPVDRYDMLGVKKMPEILRAEKPDIIFLFQDIFHLTEVVPKIKKELPEAKIVVYFPVDGAPFSVGWGNVLTMVDEVITYSDWAIQMIRDRFPKLDKTIHKLYHGVDLKTFYAKSEKEILAIRDHFKWRGKFVLSNVNRYQPRKFIPGTILAYSMFAKGYKTCKCGHHMPLSRVRCDLNMCPQSDIIEKVVHNRKDVFLYLHMMTREPSMGPGRANLLQNQLINAGFEDEDIDSILGVNDANIYGGDVSASTVNDIYNATNINISSTLGEGCGLSFLEAAATGTPSIAPRNSAIPEQLRETGHLVDNLALINLALDNGHLRPIVDTWAMAQAIEEEYLKWKEIGRDKTKDLACLKNINENFLWDDKRDKLRQIFKKALSS